MDLAYTAGAPLIALNDSGGARIQEGGTTLAGYPVISRRNVRASGVIPQELGGAQVHAENSGVAHFVYDDEETCLDDVRSLVSLFPSNSHDLPSVVETGDPLDRKCPRLMDIVPADPRTPYDIHEVIAEIADNGEFMEVHELWAGNIVCALARIGGRTVGIVANQPLVRAGVLDIHASQKAARFVQLCDAFNIPLVTLVDVPGFLPGLDQEHQGIIRHGAKLLYAYCDATVPRVQVILRKAYGGACIVMDSRSIGADLSFAWPANEIAVMGAEAAAGVIHHKKLADASRPDQLRDRLITEYKEELMHPYYASERGLVDDVIDPRHTRT